MRREDKIPAWQEGYSIRDFDTLRERTFLIPVAGWGRKLIVAALLASPGLLSIVYYRGGMPEFPEILIVSLLLVVVFGLISSIFINRVRLIPDGVEITKDFKKYFLNYSDIHSVFIADNHREIDKLVLPPGHSPLELDNRKRNILVIVLRDGSEIGCDDKRLDGVTTSWIIVNVYKPASLMNSLRMRI